ncbi:MAG: hypothetical protein R3D85_14875 [Paracoccaceae bacterium]
MNQHSDPAMPVIPIQTAVRRAAMTRVSSPFSRQASQADIATAWLTVTAASASTARRNGSSLATSSVAPR